MFKVKVITVGKCKEAWLKEALQEYEKRLRPRMQIEWVLVDSDEALQERVFKEKSFIALEIEGKSLGSEEVSRKLFSSWGLSPVFVIGGAAGLPASMKTRSAHLWSLSKLTFTHQMVRLILVEQLYRALEIEGGSSYHK